MPNFRFGRNIFYENKLKKNGSNYWSKRMLLAGWPDFILTGGGKAYGYLGAVPNMELYVQFCDEKL